MGNRARVHVLETPAPVVADALGYHQVTIANDAAQAGGTWEPFTAPPTHRRTDAPTHRR
ncbi:hypothetical protein ABT010_36710 [Streptomyces sp. NPDC002668]|uniref:hypothetical protein n=1 Tax=Streptomyces sp. NPDC002668 TaxID=3154422 RepID=UPI0033243F97